MAKAPRKPKMSAPISSWAKYDEKKTQYDKDKKKKDTLIKKHSK
jgi:hypothetical protein